MMSLVFASFSPPFCLLQVTTDLGIGRIFLQRLFPRWELQEEDFRPEASRLLVAQAESSVGAGITDAGIHWSLAVFTLTFHTCTRARKHTHTKTLTSGCVVVTRTTCDQVCSCLMGLSGDRCGLGSNQHTTCTWTHIHTYVHGETRQDTNWISGFKHSAGGS